MSEKKLIIGFVGKIASGKGMATEYLAIKYGAHSYRFSTMLRDILGRLHLDINRANMQNLSFCLRREFGEDIFAKVIARDIKNDSWHLIIVEGIRRFEDLKNLRAMPEFKMVRITAEPEVRFNRLKTRGENKDDQNKTYDEFINDEKVETELEIPQIMDEADYEINNNGTEENLFKQLDILLEKLKK